MLGWMKKPVKNILVAVAVLTSALNIVGCGKGFQNSASSSAGDNSQQGQGTGGNNVNPPPISDPLAKIEFKGRQTQGQGLGRLVFEIDRENQALIMYLPLPPEILGIIGQKTVVEFPNFPGAKVMPFKASDGSNNLAVSIPIKYIVRGGSFKNSSFNNLLPNGDRLPAFPDGEGASFALTINRNSVIHLYVGVSAAAVFIETPVWDSYLNCDGLPICIPLGPWEARNQAGTEILGYVALVAAKNPNHSGAYVTAQFPADLSRFLDDHLKY